MESESRLCSDCNTFYGRKETNFLCSDCFSSNMENVKQSSVNPPRKETIDTNDSDQISTPPSNSRKAEPLVAEEEKAPEEVSERPV